MSDQHVIEAEATEETTVVPAPAPAPATLFRTDDPALALVRAKATATALADCIKGTTMVVSVQGKDYLTVEAWQTLGSQVGVTPVIVSTRKLSDPDGWEARCEARTFDGRTLGAADSMCLRTEDRWKNSDEFEVRSMAQTRAMSRALSSVLRFIPTLAGMGGTPAEEMGNVSRGGSRPPSAKQLGFLDRLISEKYDADESQAVRALVPELNGAQVSKAIAGLKDGDMQVKAQLVEDARAWRAKHSDVPGDTDFPIDDSFGDDAPDDLPEVE